MCIRDRYLECLSLLDETKNAFAELLRCSSSKSRRHYELEELHGFLAQYRPGYMAPPRRKTNSRSTKRYDECWLIDDALTHDTAKTPSFYWRSKSRSLAPSDPVAALILAKWPTAMPLSCARYFVGKARTLPNGRMGWLQDLLHANPVLFTSNEPTKEISVTVAPQPTEGYVGLHDWIRFVRTLESWDPRAGEWTSLEIVRQLANEQLRFRLGSDSPSPLVPWNVLIPQRWMETDQGGQTFSWEAWRDMAASEDAGVMIKLNGLIDDDRYWLTPRSTSNQTDPWEKVYQSGLMLFGLLQKSLVLPCKWNPPGQERLWSLGLNGSVNRLGCSSWTKAVLQSTLLQKNLSLIHI